MKLLKYLDFIVEARGDIKAPCVISESFIRRCKKIDSPISQSLIDMDRKHNSYTFIDDNLNGETIQYTESERAIELVNKIYNPMQFPIAGSKLKIIYPQFVRAILTKLKNEL